MTATLIRLGAQIVVCVGLSSFMAVMSFGAACAQDPPEKGQPFPELYRMYYDGGLLEYCNLITPLAGKGFRAMRADLLARDHPTEEEHRRTRIAAATAIDIEYLDHGLGGQRLWCKTEGRAAFDRFEAYGRDGKLPD
jgi:hypothetical protein